MRLATAQDGPALADLVNFAGAGAPYHVWKELAAPDDDPWRVGIDRQARRADAGEVIVLEEAGTVVAALVGAMTGETPSAPTDNDPPMLRPIRALERQVPNSLFVTSFATFPRARGRGLGSRLLAHAESCAAATGLSGVAIVCSDGNTGALRLYERLGYRQIGSSPIVKDGWDSDSTQWILLFKETSS